MGGPIRLTDSDNANRQMRLVHTPIPGLVEIHSDASRDDRGSFRRLFDAEAFAENGLLSSPVHVNVSDNAKAGTLRGMHYQAEPLADRKVVTCLRGSVFDVVVDLRQASPTFLQWHGVTLSEHNGVGLDVPEHCAHGFITLEDSTTVHYLMSVPYMPDLSEGVRWNDPSIGIDWPIRPTVISKGDADLPNLSRTIRAGNRKGGTS